MKNLIDELTKAGQAHIGTDLGGLLQWAALHIGSQNEALAEVRAELEVEANTRQFMEHVLHTTKGALEAALEAVTPALCPPIELGRDLAPHINLMAAHGDPDYLKSNGMSIRHIDCREAKPRKAGKK